MENAPAAGDGGAAHRLDAGRQSLRKAIRRFSRKSGDEEAQREDFILNRPGQALKRGSILPASR
jgi:hypothetical protein